MDDRFRTKQRTRFESMVNTREMYRFGVPNWILLEEGLSGKAGRERYLSGNPFMKADKAESGQEKTDTLVPCLAGCGETLSWSGMGRKPKYCSDRCRKRHSRG